ncbi:hypothetical protein SAMN04487886_12254 [Clostridium sp. DSM 8431]|uniref:hypothetical protein n=1 Tax=Clostridium sp. DSM 8431 TaxID=1761781 RepID=UPI0008EEDE21|nr:hypothetical protein [Clostridium sp. DSM 8431]SFU85368.1 hypothetical protein SAMN04487886_12254 [Clostridium sp. DSM 8431]
MSSNKLKTIIAIIIGVFILGIFLKILPYLLAGGIVIYLVIKGYNYISLKLNKKSKKLDSTYDSYTSKANDFSDDEFDTSSAIDVDYKDVK